jgi:hypothetical protein
MPKPAIEDVVSDRNLRYLVAGLTGLLVVVVAATLFVMAGRDDPGAVTPTASSTAAGSPGPSGGPGSSGEGDPTPSTATLPSAATPSPSVIASGVASASPLPAPLATMTFLGLKLDATADPSGQPRIVTFRSDGPGTVTAKLASTSPLGTTHMCLLVGATQIRCKDWASGTIIGKTKQAHATWTVTLRGTAIETPTVNLTVTFQAVAPSVKIRHARFDGTAFSGANGIEARFTPRTPGSARLVADWGGHPFQYEIDLFDEGSGTGDATFPNQGPSTNVDQAFPVGTGDWRIVLQNTEAGFGTTDLTATVSWP